mgnify:CR=1 FL=1
MAKYEGGFECDKAAKEILKDIIVNKWFSAFTVVFDEENEMNGYAPVDVIFTAYTKSGKAVKYAIEIKHRMGYKHSDYPEWMIEKEKLNVLGEYVNNGFRAFYFNLFADGYYYLWDWKTMEENHSVKFKEIVPHTQGDDEKPTTKIRLFVKSYLAIRSGQTDCS